MKAQKLQSSLKDLMGGMSGLLAKGDIAKGSADSADSKKILNSRLKLDTGAAMAPVVSDTVSNVKVGLSENGGGGQGNEGVSYNKVAPGHGVKGKANSFVSVMALSDGYPSNVVGGLTREQVAKIINAHMSEIRNCYENTLIKNPNADGKIMVDFPVP